MTRRGRLALVLAVGLTGCPAVEAPVGREVGAASVTSAALAGAAGPPDATAPRAFAPEGWAPLPAGEGELAWTYARREPGAALTYPRAVAAAPDGGAYVVDRTGWLLRLDAEGRPRAAAPAPDPGQGGPTGLCVDARGRLLVADTHNSRVLVYDADLRLVEAFGEPGHDDGRLLLVTGVAEDGDGRRYVTDHGDHVARVQVFSPSGELLLRFGRRGAAPGELLRPRAVAVQGEWVAVADAGAHRVQVFGRDGVLAQVIGGLGAGPGELNQPYGVAFDAAGRLWVAELGNHRLQVFDAAGAPLATWGEPGRRPGQLDQPWGVAVAGDRVYLLDARNDRLHALRAEVLLAPR